MRAAQFDRLGPPEVLHVVDVAVPEPRPDEVVVRVAAAGLNPADLSVRSRVRSYGAPITFPVRPGWDLAGEIVALGSGISDWAVGDQVFGLAGFPDPAGTHAEFAAVPGSQLAPRPAGLSDTESGALPLVGLTVLQAYAYAGGIKAGERVFIDAAAGGVGHVAVQVAKASDAVVVGTATQAKHDFVRGLGVDEAVDYTTVRDPYAAAGPLDLILSSRSSASIQQAIAALRPGGRLVSIVGAVDEEARAAAARHGVQADNMIVHPDAAGLRELASLVDRGLLTVTVGQVWNLEDIRKAHEAMESGRAVGKIALVP
ncbi:NADP-dependent oxidoreductase [Streptomyces sp. NPDC004542]|uniref:NADP-dependent oxidoreductase n=1 Tax=Streptomyces sp. NPDC004542 TaxID=3154281 RepID=UPI0033BB3B38